MAEILDVPASVGAEEAANGCDEDSVEDCSALPMDQDPAWADVAPLPLDDGSRPVVAIQYDSAQRLRLGYLYALVSACEVSARALALTKQVIEDNSANYTAWGWRWRCLRAGLATKADEMDFIAGCTLDNPKNYQLWNHRRRVALELGPPDFAEELRFTRDCLAVEPKNYHVWAHRQAVLLAAYGLPQHSLGLAAAAEEGVGDGDGTQAGGGVFGLPAPCGAAIMTQGSRSGGLDYDPGDGPVPRSASAAAAASASGPAHATAAWNAEAGVGRGMWAAELEFCRLHILEDVRNNSAWTQRFFVLSHCPPLCATGGPSGVDDGSKPSYSSVAVGEIAFVSEQLLRASDNGSAWNYVRGLLALPGGAAGWAHDDRIPQLCHQILEEEPSCCGALAMLADVCTARTRAATQEQQMKTAQVAAAHAAKLWAELAVADPVRRRYWQSQAAELEADFEENRLTEPHLAT